MLTCLSCNGQDNDQPERIQLAGEIDVARCLDLIAADQGLTLTYSQAELQQLTTTVRGTMDSIRDDLIPIVQAELRTAGLAAVPTSSTSDAMLVAPVAEAQQLVAVTTLAAFRNRQESLQNYWRVRVPVESLTEDALRAATDRAPALSTARGETRIERLAMLEEMNEAIVSGYTEQVERSLERIDALGRLEAEVVTRTFKVQEGDAAAVVGSVTTAINATSRLSRRSFQGVLTASGDDSALILTAPTSEVDRWQSAIRDVLRSDEVEPRQYQIAGIDPNRLGSILLSALDATAPGDRETRSFANPLTGAVTVWTDAAGHELLGQIVQEVIDPAPASRRQLDTIDVHHREVDELAERVRVSLAALTRFETMPGREPTTTLAPDDASPPSNPLESVSSTDTLISIESDPSTNSLIVIGTPVEIEQVRDLVKELDLPTVQVQLEVLLLSLSESDTFDLGIELTKIQETGGTTFRLSSLFGLGVDAAAATLPGAATGGTGVVLDPGEFAALVAALQTLNEGRTLSMPSVLVANNQTADFNSVLQQPVVNLDITDAVSQQSFGGFEDAGTNISVDPQILAGDRLNLTYSVTLSSFVGESSSASAPPPRQQNQLSSAVTIPDGHTVALGGIELQTEAYAESGIPLISSIPWLGELFKTRSRSDSRTRFYVFIRANVHRDPMLERLRYASDQLVDELDLPDGWPEIEPRVIR